MRSEVSLELLTRRTSWLDDEGFGIAKVRLDQVGGVEPLLPESVVLGPPTRVSPEGVTGNGIVRILVSIWI